jgi:hypothetical protein
MTGGSTIVGLRPGDAPGQGVSHMVLSHLDLSDAVRPSAAPAPAEDPLPPPSAWRWIVPAALLLLAIAWIAGALWLTWPVLPGLAPLGQIQLAAALTSVPLLAGVLWLLALRTSRAEQRRFGHAAEAMRAQAAALEATVAGLAATIRTSRDQLAEQALTVTAIGNAAQEQLATVGRGFADQIAAADASATRLARATGDAREGLAELLAALLAAHGQAGSLRGLLDEAGRAAAEQIGALDAQLVALGERGRESGDAAGAAATRLAQHLQAMDTTGEAAGARLEAVVATMSQAVDALLGRTAEAIEQSRAGIVAQGDALAALVSANQAALDTAARASAEALAERVATVETAVDRVARRLDAQRDAAAALVDGLDGGIADAGHRLDQLHAQGVERSQLLAASISALGGSADAMTEALRAGDAMATKAIGTAETLLIALDAAAREIDETLPDALDRLDGRIGASQAVVAAAKPELLALVTAAESTHDAIEAIAGVVHQQRTTVDQLAGTLSDALAGGRGKAEALGTLVDEAVTRANRFAEEAAPRLLDALLRVRETAAAAADRARETLAEVIPDAARHLESESAEALRRAAAATVDRQLAEIARAASEAVEAANRASDRLDRQVRQIADSTALVEARLEDARARHEESVRDGFAPRVAGLIEALNSASIDIAKTFAPDVAETAWAAYLKGDRGVFTRRAVRLLDGGDSREIARLYDDRGPFREQVNRYIHDFEAMLRDVLQQREGQQLAVTLLSSDMGKLYVALAQAIERLR